MRAECVQLMDLESGNLCLINVLRCCCLADCICIACSQDTDEREAHDRSNPASSNAIPAAETSDRLQFVVVKSWVRHQSVETA